MELQDYEPQGPERIVTPVRDEDDKELRLDEMERDIGEAVIEPTRFSVGCLTVKVCPYGWLKITVGDNRPDTTAELLPPKEAAKFKQWMRAN